MSTIITSTNKLLQSQPSFSTGMNFGESCAISGNYMVIGTSTENSSTGSAYVYYFNGSSWVFNTRFTGQISNSYFGRSCAICSNYIVIGAYGESNGIAYVYYLNGSTWSLIARLVSPGGTAGIQYGCSCAVNNNYVAIGAYTDYNSSGSIYIYNLTAGTCNNTYSRKLAPAPGSGYFGISCAMNDSWLVGGAYGDGITGAIYIYNISTWNYQKYSGAAANSQHGWSCAINNGNTYVVAGAPVESGYGSAKVYTYNGTNWSDYNIKFTSSGTNNFGKSCAISDNYLVIGANVENTNTGSAYVYTLAGISSSTTPTKLLQSQSLLTIATTQFGNSCAINSSYIFVGAVNEYAATGAVYVFNLSGSTWGFNRKILSSDSGAILSTITSQARFGYSCAISGNYMVIGAYYENSAEGAAYVFYWNGSKWNFNTKLLQRHSGIVTSSTQFGYSCAISGNHIVIGAMGENAVYLFYLNGSTWVYNTRFGGVASSSYGCSCTMSGKYMAVGAYVESGSSGAVYIYSLSGTSWSYTGTRLASTASTPCFGYSCAMNESYLVVGAYNETAGVGAAYIHSLTGTTWSFTGRKLLQSDSGVSTTAGPNFGWSCAISGNYIVIGSKGDDSNKGAAYVYTLSGSTWSSTSRRLLQSESGTNTGTYFGTSCAISGSYIIVGSPNENTAYVFNSNGNTWSFNRKLLQSDSVKSFSGTNFGWSCAISGSYIVIGADYENATGNTEGAAYTYYINNIQTTPVISNGFGNACAISNNNIVVGNTGKTHIYTLSGSTWNTLTTLN